MTLEGIGLGEVFWLGLTLWMIAGIYDGLVRRHLRFSVDYRQWGINVRGAPAVLWAIACVFILYWLRATGGGWLIERTGQCHGDSACRLNVILSPLTSSLWTLLFLGAIAIFFGTWVYGLRDPRGPYMVYFYAPGV